MINSFLAKKIYILASKIRDENINFHLNALEKSQWLPLTEIKKFQWAKLIKLLKHAYNNSAFYKKKFTEYEITPDDIKAPEDMVRIPILTKNDLSDYYNEIKVKNGAFSFSLAKTSGSTGQALKFYKDRNSSGTGRAAMYRGHSWYGLDIGAREAKLWGIPLNLKERLIAKTGDYLLNRFREKNFQLTDKIMNDFMLNMRKSKPEYIMGYSSLVYQFAQYLKDKQINGAPFTLKMIKVTAETLFDYQRELIEKIFQCPLAIEYGATEVGIISFECPRHGHHIASENVFVEEIGSDMNSERELIITDLNNYLTPIIRYQIGDYGRLLDKACECGRGLPLLAEIIGRTSDKVYKADGTPVHSAIFSYILKDITGKDGGIRQYKIYQEERGSIKIEIVKNSNFNKNTLVALRNNIFRLLGNDMKADIMYVEDIKREPSGKLRYFVSKIVAKELH
jgi:phenylacetate-CoA ligase